MSDGTVREPRDGEREPQERHTEQDEMDHRSRSGGDAEAAGSPAEREAIARDEDDTWSDAEASGDDDAGER
jgi:hypothetical protein